MFKRRLSQVANLGVPIVRWTGDTLSRLTIGGIWVDTSDVPISPDIQPEASLANVRRWSSEIVRFLDSPVTAVAVIREPHGDLTKISVVPLTAKNRRVRAVGKSTGRARLVRKVRDDLNELMGGRSSVLLTAEDFGA